jgi:methanogenic corrinoid protein MtbC1
LEAMMTGLDETGKLFERGDYSVPELMMAALPKKRAHQSPT